MLKAHLISVSQKNVYKYKLKDVYANHKLIYSLFECHRTPEQLAASVSSGFSWVELEPTPFGKKFLVISEREINQTPDVKIQSKEIPDELFDFEKYKFSILVNSVYRKRVDEELRFKKSKGALVVMLDPEEIETWFKQRALANGFEVLDMEVGCIETQKFNKSGKDISLVTAKLSGVLKVLDKEKFIESFKGGVGRGRAYGCGLLQISVIK